MTPLSPLTHNALTQNELGVTHGFFTRQGGVSQGIYAGLNVGYGSADARENIEANRARIKQWLDVTHLATVNQTHSADCVFIGSEAEAAAAREQCADALITDRRDIALAVLTADCAPILMADRHAGLVAAIHAGWRGAQSGVVETTLDMMQSRGARPETMIAVIGPTISPQAYEVGAEFVAAFAHSHEDSDRFFAPAQRAGHAMFDLPGFILARLAHAGVTAHNMARCTYGEANMFFSHRRNTHEGLTDYGRQLSAICLR